MRRLPPLLLHLAFFNTGQSRVELTTAREEMHSIGDAPLFSLPLEGVNLLTTLRGANDENQSEAMDIM